MSSIIHSLSDVVTSLVELVWSFFTTAGDLVKHTMNFAFKFASEVVDLVVNFFKGLVDLAGGIAGFVLGNVLMLGVLAAGIFAFLQYQRSQGKTVQVGNKKLN
jgi:phage-related minor tail protein